LEEWRYSSTRSSISALDGGEWSASRPSLFTPLVSVGYEAGGPQGRSGRGGEEKNFQILPGLEPPIIQLVAQRYPGSS